ncbi:hypothetical protein DFJ73DRAFT_760499 [Zopfochytrium polystomum]|nr:hypothetical protein DFJ73DRAFT_760499 [Zopfochytrium polystomum]
MAAPVPSSTLSLATAPKSSASTSVYSHQQHPQHQHQQHQQQQHQQTSSSSSSSSFGYYVHSTPQFQGPRSAPASQLQPALAHHYSPPQAPTNNPHLYPSSFAASTANALPPSASPSSSFAQGYNYAYSTAPRNAQPQSAVGIAPYIDNESYGSWGSYGAPTRSANAATPAAAQHRPRAIKLVARTLQVHSSPQHQQQQQQAATGMTLGLHAQPIVHVHSTKTHPFASDGAAGAQQVQGFVPGGGQVYGQPFQPPSVYATPTTSAPQEPSGFRRSKSMTTGSAAPRLPAPTYNPNFSQIPAGPAHAVHHQRTLSGPNPARQQQPQATGVRMLDVDLDDLPDEEDLLSWTQFYVDAELSVGAKALNDRQLSQHQFQQQQQHQLQLQHGPTGAPAAAASPDTIDWEDLQRRRLLALRRQESPQALNPHQPSSPSAAAAAPAHSGGGNPTAGRVSAPGTPTSTLSVEPGTVAGGDDSPTPTLPAAAAAPADSTGSGSTTPSLVDPATRQSYIDAATRNSKQLDEMVSDVTGWRADQSHPSGTVVYRRHKRENSFQGGGKEIPTFMGTGVIKGYDPETVFRLIRRRDLSKWNAFSLAPNQTNTTTTTSGDPWYVTGRCVETLDDSTILTHYTLKAVSRILAGHRDFSVVEHVTHNARTSSIRLSVSSVSTPLIPPSPATVRAYLKLNGWILDPLVHPDGTVSTRLMYVLQTDVRGLVPASVGNLWVARRAMVHIPLNAYLKKHGGAAVERPIAAAAVGADEKAGREGKDGKVATPTPLADEPLVAFVRTQLDLAAQKASTAGGDREPVVILADTDAVEASFGEVAVSPQPSSTAAEWDRRGSAAAASGGAGRKFSGDASTAAGTTLPRSWRADSSAGELPSSRPTSGATTTGAGGGGGGTLLRTFRAAATAEADDDALSFASSVDESVMTVAAEAGGAAAAAAEAKGKHGEQLSPGDLDDYEIFFESEESDLLDAYASSPAPAPTPRAPQHRRTRSDSAASEAAEGDGAAGTTTTLRALLSPQPPNPGAGRGVAVRAVRAAPVPVPVPVAAAAAAGGVARAPSAGILKAGSNIGWTGDR